MIGISPSEQAGTEAQFAAQFCDRVGILTRYKFVPDGYGGESKEIESTREIKFGLSGRTASPGEDGERTRVAVFATIRLPMQTDVRELDTIADDATGEAWEVQGLVVTQFLLRASVRLERGG